MCRHHDAQRPSACPIRSSKQLHESTSHQSIRRQQGIHRSNACHGSIRAGVTPPGFDLLNPPGKISQYLML
jgi:hypothetical protein